MAVFRVERTRDYTVMSNHHLKNKDLSLKAKGLLSQMLSLPENWDYTLAGLSAINRESKDAIRSAVNELEKAGYIRRRQTDSIETASSLTGVNGKTVVGKSNAIKDRSSKYPRRKYARIKYSFHSFRHAGCEAKRNEPK